jgi:hypothetical protein
VHSDDPAPYRTLTQALLKIIISKKWVQEGAMYRLFEKTKLANPGLEDSELERVFEFIKSEIFAV